MKTLYRIQVPSGGGDGWAVEWFATIAEAKTARIKMETEGLAPKLDVVRIPSGSLVDLLNHAGAHRDALHGLFEVAPYVKGVSAPKAKGSQRRGPRGLTEKQTAYLRAVEAGENPGVTGSSKAGIVTSLRQKGFLAGENDVTDEGRKALQDVSK